MLVLAQLISDSLPNFSTCTMSGINALLIWCSWKPNNTESWPSMKKNTKMWEILAQRMTTGIPWWQVCHQYTYMPPAWQAAGAKLLHPMNLWRYVWNTTDTVGSRHSGGSYPLQPRGMLRQQYCSLELSLSHWDNPYNQHMHQAGHPLPNWVWKTAALLGTWEKKLCEMV